MLVWLLSAGVSPAVRVAAATTLRWASFSSGEARDAIAAAGGIPPLVQLLGSEAAQAPAALVLSVMAMFSTDSQQAIAAAGAIPTLVQLASSDDTSVQTAAAWALHSMINDSPDNQHAVATAGGIPALVRLSRSRKKTSRDPASTALDDMRAGRWGAEVEAALGVGQAVPPPNGAAARPATPAAAQPPKRQPSRRVCAASGCDATRGLRCCCACKMVRFCSDACQIANWHEHRPECRRIRAAAAAAQEAAPTP